jgi:NIMA (never in mitosis gene a)-related kinase
MLKDFKIIGKLGTGTFSTVYKVKRVSDGIFYALKKVKMSKLSKKGLLLFNIQVIFLEKSNALNEIRILASLDSPYIVSYMDAFYDDKSSSLCIIMDFAGGGDLL